MSKKIWLYIVVFGAAVIYLNGKRVIQSRRNSSEHDTDAAIVEGIRQNSRRFLGLYEEIYSAVKARSLEQTGAYSEWHIRMMNFPEDDAFRIAFLRRFPKENVDLEHLALLLHLIEEAGIVRGSETTWIADSASSQKYILLSSDELCVGKEYRVLKPCWMQNEIVVQQGLLEPLEA